SCVIDTGMAQFVVGAPFVSFAALPEGPTSQIDLVVTGTDGRAHSLTASAVTCEIAGPLRADVVLSGEYEIRRGERLVIDARLTFWRGRSSVRADITIRNPAPASHPGGYWELGSGGAVYIKDLSVVFRGDADKSAPAVECSPEPGQLLDRVDLPFELYQDS